MGVDVLQPQQQNLPLPATRNEGFEEQHFLRLQANYDALDALLAWQPLDRGRGKGEVPSIVALCGPAKCGKSHLGEIWRARNDALALTPSLLISGKGEINAKKPLWLDFAAHENPAQSRSQDLMTPDFMTQELERALYALYNEVLHSPNSALLITTRSEPSQWQLSLPDLRSRMRSLVTFRIFDPNDEDSAKILEHIFRTRQLTVDRRVYPYVYRRIERSFQAHHAIAEELDALSLAHKRKITLPFIVRNMSEAHFFSRT